MIAAIIAVALATAADIVTTRMVLRRGGRERNWLRVLSAPWALAVRVGISAQNLAGRRRIAQHVYAGIVGAVGQP